MMLFAGGIGLVAIRAIIRAVSPGPSPAQGIPVKVNVRSHAELSEAAIVITPAVLPRGSKPPTAVRLSFDAGPIDSRLEIHDKDRKKGTK